MFGRSPTTIGVHSSAEPTCTGRRDDDLHDPWGARARVGQVFAERAPHPGRDAFGDRPPDAGMTSAKPLEVASFSPRKGGACGGRDLEFLPRGDDKNRRVRVRLGDQRIAARPLVQLRIQRKSE
jgi:hypothetical protein